MVRTQGGLMEEFKQYGVHYQVSEDERTVVASVAGKNIGDLDDKVALADKVAAKVLGQCRRILDGDLEGVDLLEYRRHKGRRPVGWRVIKP